jgi:hypothetical protein
MKECPKRSVQTVTDGHLCILLVRTGLPYLVLEVLVRTGQALDKSSVSAPREESQGRKRRLLHARDTHVGHRSKTEAVGPEVSDFALDRSMVTFGGPA